jgi:hypothetical protein
VNVIAYWLLPAPPTHRFFAELICELAARFDAPVFDPHLTLLVAPMNSHSPVEVISAIGTLGVVSSVVGVQWSEQFTKTLFVQFQKTDAIQKLSDTICELSGSNQGDTIDPHLSLLYKHMPEQTKRDLANSIQLPFREVIFDSLCAIRCASPTQTADDVRRWQRISPR